MVTLRRCIIFNFFMSSAVYGCHTLLAYTCVGLTNDIYACSFTLVEVMLRFLLGNLSVFNCFVAYVVYVTMPFQVGLDGIAKILCLIIMF